MKMFRLFVLWLILSSECCALGNSTELMTRMRLDSTNDYYRIKNANNFFEMMLRKLPKEINCINIVDGSDALDHDRFDFIHHILHRSQQVTIQHDDLRSSRDFFVGEMNLLLIDDYWDLE